MAKIYICNCLQDINLYELSQPITVISQIYARLGLKSSTLIAHNLVLNNNLLHSFRQKSPLMVNNLVKSLETSAKHIKPYLQLLTK